MIMIILITYNDNNNTANYSKNRAAGQANDKQQVYNIEDIDNSNSTKS